MAPSRVPKILEAMKPAMVRHWASCREAGLEGHTPENHARIDQALERYGWALSGMWGRPAKDAILAPMKKLFEELDQINAEAGGGLLETDERELLVPVIIACAKGVGLDVASFPDGDPTGPYRNF